MEKIKATRKHPTYHTNTIFEHTAFEIAGEIFEILHALQVITYN